MSHLESERYVLDSVHPEAGVTAGAQSACETHERVRQYR